MRSLSQGPSECLYHLTHVDNIPSLVRNGILSHDEANRNRLITRDISSNFVQKIRDEKVDPLFSRPLHAYASLYFYPRNPMLAAVQAQHRDVAILGVSLKVLSSPNTIFTDGNAASEQSHFFSDYDDLEKIEWDIVFSVKANPSDEERRIQCAEILVYPKVYPIGITAIYCNDQEQKDQIVHSLASMGLLSNIRVDRSLFFNEP